MHRHYTALPAKRAYNVAGMGPKDVRVAEVHIATAMGELIQVETSVFATAVKAVCLPSAASPVSTAAFRMNPSGGLESEWRPIGATRLGQIHCLVTQLRGEAGRRQVPSTSIALAENGGGILGTEAASPCITATGCVLGNAAQYSNCLETWWA